MSDTDEIVRAKARDARRRAIVGALQQVVTAERAAAQAVTELVELPGAAGISDQQHDSLRLALNDMEAARALQERARVLISGSGAVA